jgi:hypothetical protein
MHLKPTVGCQISSLIFGFVGDPIHIPWKITEGRQSSLPLGVYLEGIARAFTWLKWLGGIMHRKPTAGCLISILKFEKTLWRGVSINIPWKIYQQWQSSCPLWAYVKGIARVFNWLKYLGGIMHLKPTSGCQISTLIFENKLWRGVSINIPWKIYQERQSSSPLWISMKGIAQVFNWPKCLCGIMRLKPTAGCQISTLIFEKQLWSGVSINIPWKIYQERQSSCPLWA